MSNTEIVVEVHPQLHLDLNHFVTSVLPKSSFLTPTTWRAPEINVLTAPTLANVLRAKKKKIYIYIAVPDSSKKKKKKKKILNIRQSSAWYSTCPVAVRISTTLLNKFCTIFSVEV
jgi:hypothetical protein